MQKIVLICGFGGSGKTTIADKLFQYYESAALVRADDLFIINPLNVDSKEGREQIGRIKLKNSLSLIACFMHEGFEHVIVEGLVWSQEELDAVVEIADTVHAGTYCFWLQASREVRHNRVLNRSRDDADTQEFLEKVEKAISDPTPLVVQKGVYEEIVTEHRVPQEIVQEISSSIETDYLLSSPKNVVHLQKSINALNEGSVVEIEL